MKTKIAQNIRFFRQQKHMTQEQLANLLNSKKSLISNYENGRSTPDIITWCKLAKFFDVTLDELVEYSED